MSLAKYNDIVDGVRLDHCLYHMVRLDGDTLEPGYMDHHYRALGESIREFKEKYDKTVFRHPPLLDSGPLSCEVLTIEGVAVRHLIDYDPTITAKRSIVDVFAGGQNELG